MNLKINNKLDYLNLGSVIGSLIGFVLALVGCLALSNKVGIGVNTSLSPVVYVGIAVLVVGLALSIAGNIYYEKKDDMNRIFASTALYVAVIALMIVAVVIILTILMPVLHPTNG